MGETPFFSTDRLWRALRPAIKRNLRNGRMCRGAKRPYVRASHKKKPAKWTGVQGREAPLH